MRNLFLSIFLICGMTSCSFFVTDVTDGIRAANAVEESGLNTFDSIKALLEKAHLPVEIKEQLLIDIKGEESKFKMLSAELRRYIESFGKVDYQKLSKDIYDLLQKSRGGDSK